jgi:hypothetical protein
MVMHSAARASLQLAQNAYAIASNRYATDASRWKEARQLLKQSDFGENSNPQFERAFGSIAFTYLQEKAPGLLPHILGFQLLDRSEQGRKAVGVFVAKLGNRVIDIPMFFINGELKGHQFMRMRQPEMFVPLRESFLDFLFSKMPQDLGDAEGQLTSANPTRSTPNIRPFSGSRFFKGAAEIDYAHPWAADNGVFEAYYDMRLSPTYLKIATALRDNKPLPGVNLLDVLKTSETLLKTAARLADEYPEFGQRMIKHHGADWLGKAAAAVMANRPAKLSKLSSIYAGEGLSLNRGVRKVSQSLRYFDRVPPLATEDRKDAIRQEIERFGFFADDNRPVEKLSKAYKVENRSLQISPPTMRGIYRVTFEGGRVAEAAVFPGDCRVDASRDLIVEMQTKKYAEGERDEYVVAHGSAGEKKSIGELREKMKTKSRPSENDVFLVVLESGSVAGPFIAEEKTAKDSFTVDTLCGCGSYIDTVEFRDSNRSASQITDRLLLVPSTASVWVLGKVTPDEDGYVPYTQRDELKTKLMPRSQMDIAALDKYANVSLRVKQAGAVEFNEQLVSAAIARHTLLSVCGLSKEAADAMLVPSSDVQRYCVLPAGTEVSLLRDKLAAPNYTPSVEFPQMSEPYASESGRYSIENPERQFSEADPQPMREETLEPYDDIPGQLPGQRSGAGPGEDPTVAANEVDALFDTSGLLSVIRNSRIDAQIKRTTQSLLKSINELGAALFMFYAHNDEFSEMYGEDAMEDLEAALISSFEGGGDLFITLSRRSADPHPELDISDLPQQ